MTMPLELDPEKTWKDWKWHLRHAIRTVEELRDWVAVTPEEEDAIRASEGRYRWQITPYYASLMDPIDSSCPIRRQAVPSSEELQIADGADVDPVGDREYRVTNRVVHKYPDRVVLLVTSRCPVYCRHCTRKYHTTDVNGTYFGNAESEAFDADFDYIRAHPEISDVLLTGGDPLMYSDQRLKTILSALRAIPHVQIIRIGTRFPVLLPQRITPELCAMLERYHPVWVSTHFNHPKEITEEAAAACDRLLRSGIPVQNQSVLLRGVNDDAEVLRRLFKQLVSIRVRPYYLYHCDDVVGVSHFMTTIEEGRSLIESLAGHITGFAVPQYILTTRAGKIPLARSVVETTNDGFVLWSYQQRPVRVDGTGRAL